MNFFTRLNNWIRNILMDDVDKPIKGMPKYHKGFGSKRNPTERLNEKFERQKKHNRHGRL